jgi:integrase/recombinase XerD
LNRFDEFIRERKYLHNVSANTPRWYKHAFKWLPSENPTQDTLKGVVVERRRRGLKETGVTLLSAPLMLIFIGIALRTFERKCGAGCTHPRIRQLKEPQIVLPTLTEAFNRMRKKSGDIW